MSVDFFNTLCKESARTDETFGLCDDQDQTKAYTNTSDRTKWIATVFNKYKESKEIIFTPLDKCMTITKTGTKDQESLCDGMLTFSDSLFLVELKKQHTGGWITEAKLQLRNTIRLIHEHHPNMEHVRYKKAYACNCKHPRFEVITNSNQKAFMKESGGFRLDIQAKINI